MIIYEDAFDDKITSPAPISSDAPPDISGGI